MADTGRVVLRVERRLPITTLTFRWFANASGDAERRFRTPIKGRIFKLTTDPATGDTQPLDNWDVTIEDENEVDILRGNGANRDNATQEIIALDTDSTIPDTPQMAVGTKQLVFKVENAGASNAGTVIVSVIA